MSRVRRALLALVLCVPIGCSLITDTDGLTVPSTGGTEAGAASDAGGADASSEAASAGDGSSGGGDCACPEGSELKNGSCFVSSKTTHGACTGPIVAPPCALTYVVELCSDGAKFNYDSQCGGTARQSAFFSLGDSPLDRWKVVANGIDVFARTQDCQKGAPQCVVDTSATAFLAEFGATVAIGKLITAGCNTINVKIEPTAQMGDGGR